jgi:hypothetical protein
MKSADRSSWRSALIGSWVLICIVTSLIFGAGNPSKKESNFHLDMMNLDMSVALATGGAVDSRYENAKYGGALLYVNLRANSWSPGLADKYRLALLSRGWRQRAPEKGSLSLCKNGTIATIHLLSGVDSSRGRSREVYGFSMEYGGDTIKLCQ